MVGAFSGFPGNGFYFLGPFSGIHGNNRFLAGPSSGIHGNGFYILDPISGTHGNNRFLQGPFREFTETAFTCWTAFREFTEMVLFGARSHDITTQARNQVLPAMATAALDPNLA